MLKLQPKTVVMIYEIRQGRSIYSCCIRKIRGSAVDGVQGIMMLRPASAAQKSGADDEKPPCHAPRTHW